MFPRFSRRHSGMTLTPFLPEFAFLRAGIREERGGRGKKLSGTCFPESSCLAY